MEIIKAFNDNSLNIDITIIGTIIEPLFRASDIGEVLEITNIRTSILDYDITEKEVHSMDTNGGKQNITFLTEKGLYKILFKSRKPIAKKFQNWVCDVLKEIRLQGRYTFEKQMLEKDLIIETTKKENYKSVENAIVTQFPVNTECIYIGTIDNTNDKNEKLIKFGHTNNLSNRITEHKKIYNNFVLINAFRVQNKVEIENLIKTCPNIKKQIRSIEINNKNKTEIIAYNEDTFTIKNLTKYISDIIHSKTYSIDNFNRIIKKNEELENENRVLKEENKSQENIISQKNVEINNLKEKYENNQKIINSIKDDNECIYKNVLLPEDEINNKFNDFVNTVCIVRQDVEEISVNIEGRYRLWSQVKPTKEVFHLLKNYLDTRFKLKRVNGSHGYIGIKLKPVEYIKNKDNSVVETFIFQTCEFSDCGKILNSVLLNEYKKWKLSVNKELSENDMKYIKEYLNDSPYALKATVWSENESNEGYYGLSLKETYKPKQINISTTGKKVYKREIKSNNLLKTWDTIAKASKDENMCTAKMSRSIKNKTVVNNDYYYCLT